MKKILIIFASIILISTCTPKEVTKEIIRPQEIPLDQALINKKNDLIKKIKEFEAKYPEKCTIRKTTGGYLLINEDYFILSENINKCLSEISSQLIGAVKENNSESELLRVRK